MVGGTVGTMVEGTVVGAIVVGGEGTVVEGTVERKNFGVCGSATSIMIRPIKLNLLFIVT